jgi:hypothetical protein
LSDIVRTNKGQDTLKERATWKMGVHGSMMLNWISKKKDGSSWAVFMLFRIGTRDGQHEYGNEPSAYARKQKIP